MKDKYFLPDPSTEAADKRNDFNTPHVVYINAKGTLSSASKALNFHIGHTVVFEGKNFEEAHAFANANYSNYQPPVISPE